MEWVSVAERIWKDVTNYDTRRVRHRDSLPLKQRISFSTGHIFNDLCAAVWFTYVLVYFNKVVGLSPEKVGYLFVIAQIADAFFTPVIAIASDRFVPKALQFYGKRKVWHLFGSILVIFTWPFLFSPCLGCDDNSSQSAILGHYAVVVLILHLGWASVQIAHRSMIPEIARRPSEVVELNAIKSSLSFVSGIFVFCVTWILFGEASGENVTPALWKHFTTLSLIITGFGFVFSSIFHWGTQDTTAVRQHSRNEMEESRDVYVEGSASASASQLSEAESFDTIREKASRTWRSWRDWLNDPDFYKMGVVYTCTRVAVNISQLYFVLYLTETLQFNKEAMAYFPLVMLLTGAIANAAVRKINNHLGNKWTFCAAGLVVLTSSMWFQLQSISGKNLAFVATILLGSGSSILLVTAMNLTADLITIDKESSSFVYAALRFLDKGVVGLVVLIIQKNYPNSPPGIDCPSCGDYARQVFTLTPAITVLIAIVTVFFTFKTTIVVTCINTATREDKAVQTDVISSLFGGSTDLYPMDENTPTKDGLPLAAYTTTNVLMATKLQGDPTMTVQSAPEIIPNAPLQGYREDDFSMDSLAVCGGFSATTDDGNSDDGKADIYRQIRALRSTQI